MIFASFVFLFGFLPLVLFGYYALPGRRRNAFLTLASYAFYGWWRPDFVLLMFSSTVVDYVAARRVADGPAGHRKLWLAASVCTNLGLLGYFKYANLVVHSFGALLDQSLQWEDIILPVGISFYTFQSMSYTIDVYRGDARPVRSFLDLACFVSMFPQLIAGPIVRYRQIEHELHERTHDFAKMSAGVFLFMIGFAKKILIADNVALIADPVFQSTPGFADAWTGVAAYALQIYFDFSGYSDMAIGLGLMFGFHFPINFDSPYRSTSITDFWRRWHISLSSWLRDYLYLPLGGNRLGPGRTYVNLMTTMVLGGLWHGASWTFVLWGGYQGTFLVIERLGGKRPVYAGLPRPFRCAITLVIVLIGWAIFRSDSPEVMGAIFRGLFGAAGPGAFPVPRMHSTESQIALVAGACIVFFAPQARELATRFRPTTYWSVFALFLVAIGQLASRDFTPFIYFQF